MDRLFTVVLLVAVFGGEYTRAVMYNPFGYCERKSGYAFSGSDGFYCDGNTQKYCNCRMNCYGDRRLRGVEENENEAEQLEDASQDSFLKLLAEEEDAEPARDWAKATEEAEAANKGRELAYRSYRSYSSYRSYRAPSYSSYRSYRAPSYSSYRSYRAPSYSSYRSYRAPSYSYRSYSPGTTYSYVSGNTGYTYYKPSSYYYTPYVPYTPHIIHTYSYNSYYSRRCYQECYTQSEVSCSSGCQNGRCRPASMSCGTAISSAQTDTVSCKTTSGDKADVKAQCEANTAPPVVTESAVCPYGNAEWGLPNNYLPWKDKQDDQLVNSFGAAASDAQWFRDVAFNRLYQPLNVSKINVTSPLYAQRDTARSRLAAAKAELTAFYESKKQYFISFSCLRNFPQCTTSGCPSRSSDCGDRTACEKRCTEVSQVLKDFTAQCKTLLASKDTNGTALYEISGQPLFTCFPLYMTNSQGQKVEYERDCLGNQGEQAEYPGLCIAFQNDYLQQMRAGDAPGTAPLPALAAIVLAAVGATALRM